MKNNNMESNTPMREAFKKLDEELSFCERNVELGIGFAVEGLREHCRILREILNAALAAQLRNCDVGTAEEQYERFRRQCGAQDCRDCPVHARWDFSQIGSESCQFVWAQMPYEAEKKGESDGR